MQLASVLLLLAAFTRAQDGPNTASTLSTDSKDLAVHRNHCATLGFDTDALDCRLCVDLSNFFASRASKPKKKTTKAITLVTKECHACCTDFSKALEAEGRRYSRVALAVNRLRLKRYPKVANFLEHQAAQIPRLEVVETQPRLPTLQFFDKNGESVEEISVAHWDENSIAEFIAKKLLPVEGEKGIVEMEVKAVKL